MEFKERLLQSLSRRFLNLSAKLETLQVEDRVRAVTATSASLIPTHTKQSELAILYKLASSRPPKCRALEIGSHLGASACYIAAGLAPKQGHLFCVDTWNNETMPEGEQDTLDEFDNNTRRFRSLITTIRKRSDELVESDLETPLGFAFIDGDHSYSSVKTDFEKISPWIQPGGIIAFHDSTPIFPGVPRVIGEALASGEWTLSGFVDSLCWLERRG